MKWLKDLVAVAKEAREEARSPKVSLNTVQAVVADFFERVDAAEQRGLAKRAVVEQKRERANQILADAAKDEAVATRLLNAVKRVRKVLGSN